MNNLTLAPAAFGLAARNWAAAHAPGSAFTIADPTGFGEAFVDIVDARRAGERRALFVLFEHPRRMLMRAVVDHLTGQFGYDGFLSRMASFAAGKLVINEQPQSATEAAMFGPLIARAWDDLCVTADAIAFRSRYEYEMAAAFFGSRPNGAVIYAPRDNRVPAPVPAMQLAPRIAIWADGICDELVRAAVRMASDIRLETVVIRDEPLAGVETIRVAAAAAVLASSRLIVSLSDDPGTARELAEFSRPLCAATHGASEYVLGVQTFDIWNASDAIDAMLRALGGVLPCVIERPETPNIFDRPSRVYSPEAPLVSIVMAVYNRLGHLERNLERLQRQTYENIEIIVVSNNCPRADAICAKFPNVRYIHRDENSGEAGIPRNDGYKAARGTFITWLDDDDIFFDDHVERMVEACSSGTDIVYSNFLLQIVEPQPDGSERLTGYDIEKGKAITPLELMITNRIGYMTVFARKSVYDRVGVFDADTLLGGSEVELWLRMSSTFAMAHVERPSAMYTIRKNWEGSLTASNAGLFVQGYEMMYEKYPAAGLPLIQAGRQQHLASLRASGSPARQPRYFATGAV